MKAFLVLLLTSLLLTSAFADCPAQGLRLRAYTTAVAFGAKTAVATTTFGAIDGFVPNSAGTAGSVIADGFLTPTVDGSYVFALTDTGSVRLIVNGQEIITKTTIATTAAQDVSTTVTLQANTAVPIKVYFTKGAKTASVTLQWKGPNDSAFSTIPIAVLSSSYCMVDIQDVLQIADSAQTYSFGILLSYAASSAVNVVFTSPLRLSTCSISLTTTSAVTVDMYIDPSIYIPTTCVPISFVATSQDPNFNGQTGSLCLKKTTSVFKSLAFGDPHFRTFAGNYHDLYTLGDFYYLRHYSGEFAAQIRVTSCSTAACISAITVQHRSAVFTVYVSQNSAQISVIGDLTANGMFISTIPSGYFISTYAGVVLNIKSRKMAGTTILSVDSTIPQYLTSKIFGLSGYAAVTGNDFYPPSGAVLTTSSTFQQSWAVPSAENIFLNPSVTIPRIRNSPAPAALPNIADCASSPLSQNSLFPASTSLPSFVYTFPSFTPDLTTGSSLSSTASSVCTDALSPLQTACSACTSESLVSQCTIDYQLAGGSDLLVDSAAAFSSLCIATCLKKAIAIPSAVSCPDNCNLRGSCSSGTCSCNSGYSGSACELVLDSSPSITNIYPPSGAPCGMNITVYGSNLSGATCNFGSVSVSSITINSGQILCPIPTQSFTSGDVSLSVTKSNLSSNSVNFRYYAACCTQPCLNGGTCSENISLGYSNCTCTSLFVGSTCATPYDPCSSSPCQNGATCTSYASGFICQCASGFKGNRCSQKSNCATFYLDSLCYDTNTDTTSYCYHLSMDADPSCAPVSLTVPSNCGTALSTSPAATWVSGAMKWTSFTGTEFCATFSSFPRPTVASVVVQYGENATYSVETPKC